MSSKSGHDSVADKLEAELLHLIETIEPEKLQAWLLDRTPSEIKTLAPRISRAAKERFARADETLKVAMSAPLPRIINPHLASVPTTELADYARKQCPTFHRQSSLLALALLTSGTLGEAKEIVHHQRLRTEHHPLLLALLQKIQPSWLPAFVDHVLDVRWTPMMTHDLWKLADDLIRTKALPPSESPTYALGMVITAREHRKDQERGALAFLRRRPHLLETQLWRLFELEANGPNSVAAYDALATVKSQRPYFTPEQTWKHALRELCREGQLDRGRLLDASLRALLSDFTGGLPAWHARFHESLEPTLEERRLRVETYLKLLSSQQASTVRYGLDVLPELVSNSWVSDEDLLAALSSPLRSKHKVTVTTSIKYLEALAKRRSDLRTEIMLGMTDALALNFANLQKRILRFLLTYPEGKSTALISAVAPWRDSIAPSLRDLFHQLVPNDSPRGIAATVPVSAPTAVLSCLADERRISPIASLEELIDAIIVGLENPYDVMATERILDAAIRLPAPQNETSRRLLAPAVKRARHHLKVYEEERHYNNRFYPPDFGKLLSLILTWLGTPQTWTPKYVYEEQKFHFARLNGIRQSLLAKQSFPQLCTPTHAGFWIEPETLVRRALQWREAKAKPSTHDFIIALLRLAPEKRESAVKLAGALTDEWGMALRYGLGELDIPVGNDIPLWIAAARARCREQNDESFLKKYPNLGPGAGEIGSWDFHRVFERVTNPHSGKEFEFSFIHAAIAPPVGASVPENYFTVALHTREIFAGYIANANSRLTTVRSPDKSAYLWLHSYWPSDKNAIYGMGVMDLSNHPDLGPDYHPSLALLPFLADPCEGYGSNALLLISLALDSKHVEVRVGAVHAIASGITHGRIDLAALARSVHQTMPLHHFSAARLHRSLEEWDRISDHHSLAAIDFLISFFLATPSEIPEGSSKLLSFLHESLIRHTRKLDSTQAAAFQRLFPGQNQASKLARRIVAL